MPFRFADSEANRENMFTTFAQKGTYPINRSQHTAQSSLGRKGKDEEAINGASSLWVHNRRSMETAQKILSHLERAIPSPSEKPPLHRQINPEIASHSVLNKNKKQESFQGSGSTNQKIPDVNMVLYFN
jgi:SPX domain protein involved in polyphosphate accumulation